jgi:hypothetical protein
MRFRYGHRSANVLKLLFWPTSLILKMIPKSRVLENAYLKYTSIPN